MKNVICKMKPSAATWFATAKSAYPGHHAEFVPPILRAVNVNRAQFSAYVSAPLTAKNVITDLHTKSAIPILLVKNAQLHLLTKSVAIPQLVAFVRLSVKLESVKQSISLYVLLKMVAAFAATRVLKCAAW